MSALQVYWGSGSPFAWTVLLALEFKGLPYESHLLQFSKKEHKTEAMLKMNPRGKIPILKDGETVVYETPAILHYLEKKFPQKPYFGTTPEATAKIIQRISEVQSYLQKPVMDTVRPILFNQVAGKEADIRKKAGFAHEELLVFEKMLGEHAFVAGADISAADFVFFPLMALFVRGLEKPEAQPFELGFLPLGARYPNIQKWMKRIEGMPLFEKTYPPHWRG